MIDEKMARYMAEVYICNGKCQDDVTKNYVHCKNCTRPDDFIAGLIAGLRLTRPKWHMVANGDLPKENKRYLCRIKGFVGGGISHECFDYDTEYNIWNYANGDVVAWCEIPKYTEIRYLVPVADRYLIPIDLKEYMESFGASEFEKRLLEETGNEEADKQETLSVS